MVNISKLQIILISIIPVFLWLIFLRLKRKRNEPIKLILYSFLLGCVSALIIVGLQYIYFAYSNNTILNKFISEGFSTNMIIVIFAIVEEIIKNFFIFMFIIFNLVEIDHKSDGIEYGIALGLGFAFVENIYYFMDILKLHNLEIFTQVFIFRSLGTMFAHIIFSGLFGFIIGYIFYDSLYEQKIIKKFNEMYFKFFSFIYEIFTIHIFRRHILIDKPSRKGHYFLQAILEALFLSIILHIIFNLLLILKIFGINTTFLITPFLFILGLYIIKLLQSDHKK